VEGDVVAGVVVASTSVATFIRMIAAAPRSTARLSPRVVAIAPNTRASATSCCCATTPVVAASAIDSCFNGIVVNTPEQVLMLLYLCLRYVSLLDRVTPVSPASFRSSRP
jgi:hypothetical protein